MIMHLDTFRESLRAQGYDEAEVFIEDEKMNLIPVTDELQIHYIHDVTTGRLRVVISAIPGA